MPVFTIGIVAFEDVDPAFPLFNTTGAGLDGNTYTVDADAEFITLSIDDNDGDTSFDDGFLDPPNNSTGGNNQLLSEQVTVNGTTYGPANPGDPPTDQVELEFAFETTDGQTFYVVRIDGVNVGLTGTTLPQPDQEFTILYTSDTSTEPYEDIPCFADDTLIDTPSGPRSVETLDEGDLVLTVDRGAMPLKAVLRRTLGLAELIANPQLRPIRFAPGTVGNERELTVSPQHRMLIAGWQAELHFFETELLVPAKFLVNGTTIRVAPLGEPVTYHQLVFDGHQLVRSEGAISESMDPSGDMAGRDGVRQELDAVFLSTAAAARARPGGPTSRPVLRRYEAAVLSMGEVGAA